MKGKHLLWTSLIAALVFNLAMVGWVIAPPLTKLEVAPSSLGKAYPGDIISVDINVVNVEGLNSWEVVLRWNPLVMKPVAVAQGPFLSDFGPTMFLYSIGILGDYVRVGESGLLPSVVGSGSGRLATVTLEAIGSGSTSLELTETKLLDVSMKPMAHSTYDCQVSVHAVGEVTGRWEDRQRHSISTDGDINTLYAKAVNLISLDSPVEIYDVQVYVEFLGFTPDGTRIWLLSTTAVIGRGEEVVLSVEFDTAEWGVGKYDMIARAFFSYDGTAWYRGAKGKILSFVVLP